MLVVLPPFHLPPPPPLLLMLIKMFCLPCGTSNMHAALPSLLQLIVWNKQR